MNVSDSTKVVVVGQGYVGLPVAITAAERGYNVVGIDLDSRKVEMLNAGSSPVEDITDAQIQEMAAAGRYQATDSYAGAEGFDIAVISVPTPLRATVPDLSYIEEAGRMLAPYVSVGATVILESTTYPGTTEKLFGPILEEVSGLKAGEDFYLGYSPERIDPGNTTYGLVETPKVVSGMNPASLNRVKSFFDSIIDTTVPVRGTREAELTKLLENTFRHVNIALVNELAQFAGMLDIDIWEAIEAANSKPFGFMKFTPGPGVGGHCLPIDPSYLSWQVKTELGRPFRFVELANDVNSHMPDYVVQRVADILNEHSKSIRNQRILLAGLSYKRDTGDTREAPALTIARLLLQRGAEVVAADSWVSEVNWPAGVGSVDYCKKEIDSADLVILINDHSDFDLDLLANSTTPIFDTRNVISSINSYKL